MTEAKIYLIRGYVSRFTQIKKIGQLLIHKKSIIKLWIKNKRFIRLSIKIKNTVNKDQKCHRARGLAPFKVNGYCHTTRIYLTDLNLHFTNYAMQSATSVRFNTKGLGCDFMLKAVRKLINVATWVRAVP